jgi:hypothetical protein
MQFKSVGDKEIIKREASGPHTDRIFSNNGSLCPLWSHHSTLLLYLGHRGLQILNSSHGNNIIRLYYTAAVSHTKPASAGNAQSVSSAVQLNVFHTSLELPTSSFSAGLVHPSNIPLHLASFPWNTDNSASKTAYKTDCPSSFFFSFFC